MKQKSPAYQWYPKDILTDDAVTQMSFEVEGFYRYCLDVSWLSNGLPVDDDARFALIQKCKLRSDFDRLWSQVAFKFRVGRGGKLRNRRQEAERAKQRKHSKERKLSAEKRWQKERQKPDANASANASDLHMQTGCSAFALASADQDQHPQEPRALGAPRTRQLHMDLRELADVRRHLLSACHRLIETDPDCSDSSPFQLSTLAGRLKEIAAHDLHVADYGEDKIQKILTAVLGTRARRLA